MEKTVKDEVMSKRLTRRQVARLLGVHVSQVEGLDGWQLHPVQGVDRRWTYDRREVAAVLTDSVPEGTIAAHVFQAFEDRKDPFDVALETLQPLQRILELRVQYQSVDGAIMLMKDQVERLRTFLGTTKIDDPESFGEALAARLASEYARGYCYGKRAGQAAAGSSS